MGSVVGDLLPLALGVAISPVPIIAVILMLLAPKARAASVGFLVGWVVGITVLVTAVALLADPSADSSSGETSTWSSVAKLVLGALCLLVAVRQWRSRPKPGEDAALPKWMSAIDSFTAGKALGLGFLLSAVNPKNLTLGLAGGLVIAGGGLGGSDTAVAIAIFVVIGSSTVAVPVLGFLLAQQRMKKPLDDLRVWLTANNTTVMAVLMLVLGFVLVGKGLGGIW